MPVAEFLKPAGYWSCEISAARRRNDGDIRAAYFVELHDRLAAMSEGAVKELGTVRVPQQGGDLFVSAEASSPLCRGIQADLNAAANIGLKALLDPDWPGRWWYVPCESQTLFPLKTNTKGSAALDPKARLRLADGAERDDGNRPINLWHDVTAVPINERTWLTYRAYRLEVERRVIQSLRSQFRERCLKVEAFDPF